ncbi:DNA methyltransferase [Okeania sp.]|uniref:DNA methyltransferase n=1 Tax=Okeania sp. TaxID=3100323 RepID=UPI002B4B582F|nr:DNA methyltransferase [Okeania sp.]MEB3340168.1 DNA methyltransferase [Okeania sp.]
MTAIINKKPEYTFQYNNKLGRHGWLRLTPAYSVKLVKKLLDNIEKPLFILDPFSGTATTGLVAAEHKLSAHLFDINPFLIWLGNAKCRNYTNDEIAAIYDKISRINDKLKLFLGQDNWISNIYNIEPWWSRNTLHILAALRAVIIEDFGEPEINNANSIVWIAFCRLIIETSSASFNHVSISFNDKLTAFEVGQIIDIFQDICGEILESSRQLISGKAKVIYGDSRYLKSSANVLYSHVITSPPYPNRISYIRELRPYMYWTGFLKTANQAGELDWQAIGGTWGIATSRLGDWKPKTNSIPVTILETVELIRQSNRKNSNLMANYVHKYFDDMSLHFDNLKHLLLDGAE